MIDYYAVIKITLGLGVAEKKQSFHTMLVETNWVTLEDKFLLSVVFKVYIYFEPAITFLRILSH